MPTQTETVNDVQTVPSAPYRTRTVMAHYLHGKPTHLKATASYPYPCDLILSHHHPRQVMAYSILFRGFEYDVLDYNVPRPEAQGA